MNVNVKAFQRPNDGNSVDLGAQAIRDPTFVRRDDGASQNRLNDLAKYSTIVLTQYYRTIVLTYNSDILL